MIFSARSTPVLTCSGTTRPPPSPLRPAGRRTSNSPPKSEPAWRWTGGEDMRALERSGGDWRARLLGGATRPTASGAVQRDPVPRSARAFAPARPRRGTHIAHVCAAGAPALRSTRDVPRAPRLPPRRPRQGRRRLDFELDRALGGSRPPGRGVKHRALMHTTSRRRAHPPLTRRSSPPTPTTSPPRCASAPPTTSRSRRAAPAAARPGSVPVAGGVVLATEAMRAVYKLSREDSGCWCASPG